jgi:hypothetical protein
MLGVPAMGRKMVQYVALLVKIPAGFGNVGEIDLAKNRILIYGTTQKQPVAINAYGVQKIFD